jgi:hypothetical protein
MNAIADIREERVESPLLTWAQFLHELEQGKPNAGKQIATMNMRTVLGGFCRFHGTEAQQKACAKLKSLYERSQVGGAKAVDPSIEPVDGGGINPEANIEIGADARKEYNRVVALLEAADAKQRVKAGTHLERIEFVVIRERGPTPYAKWRGFGEGGRGVSRGMVEVREIADRLAEHWQLQARRG